MLGSCQLRAECKCSGWMLMVVVVVVVVVDCGRCLRELEALGGVGVVGSFWGREEGKGRE